jgi:hypothetical protein
MQLMPLPGCSSVGWHVTVSDAAQVRRASWRTPGRMDPYLHTHLVIANRVHGVDGIWRAPRAAHRARP